MLTTLVLSLALGAAPKVDAKLVGTWLAGGAPFVTFNANGTGAMEDGKVKWTADGSTLTVTDDEGTADKATYKVSGDSMTMTMGGIPITLTRAQAGVEVKKQGAFAAKAAKQNAMSEEDADKEALAEAQAWLQKNGQGQGAQPVQPAQPGRGQVAAPQRGGGGNDQLSRLLLSSAWCSFTYNKISGASNTTKYRFFANGSWSTGGRAETYNSGAAGSVAGQYDSSGGGQWESRNNQLFMSGPGEPLQPVPGFNVTQNSSGYSIINADGREFSSCN